MKKMLSRKPKKPKPSMKKAGDNQVILVAVFLLFSFFAGCYNQGMQAKKKLSANTKQESNNDSLFKLVQYVKNDPVNKSKIVGQFLNEKKDGIWRYFIMEKLQKVEIYVSGKLIGNYYPETNNSYEKYEFTMPDNTERQFYFKGKQSVIEKNINADITIMDKFDQFKKTDTIITTRYVNDNIIFSLLSTKIGKYHALIVPVKDTNVLNINLNTKNFTLK
jgi:hypothetical protein